MFSDFLSLSFLFGVLTVIASVAATVHVLLNKRDVRAATGWVGVIWIAPIFGAIAYTILGVNRIRRRAVAIFGEPEERPVAATASPDAASFGLSGIGRLLDGLVRRPILGGNRVQPLVGGDDAYSAMLAAIRRAERSIALETYIFDHDQTGLEFAEELERATQRGVEVRVLIDAIGDRYSRPHMVSELRQRGVLARHFLPTLMPWRAPYFNLRNHRKILVVDGRVGFTGGMNIRHGHRMEAAAESRVTDVHFELEGPGVSQLLDVFFEDWLFAAQEKLEGPQWAAARERAGEVSVRAISDGPDYDLDQIRWSLLGGVACAQRTLKIQTPYFLPTPGLLAGLQTAARRGVAVDILLPRVSNLLLVHWASRAMWHEVLEAGVRVWLVPKPFDHSKLMIMDDQWSFVGSSNWDPRSLRLNFELNLECSSSELNSELDRLLEDKKRRAHLLTEEEHQRRKWPVRLLDGATRLFSPYL